MKVNHLRDLEVGQDINLPLEGCIRRGILKEINVETDRIIIKTYLRRETRYSSHKIKTVEKWYEDTYQEVY